MRSLAARIGRFLKSRQKDGPLKDPTAKATIDAILESLTECGECLTGIEVLLEPLAVPPTGDRPADFGKRINFVCNASYIKRQQDLIKTHVDNLTVDLILLQSLDQSATLKRLQKLSTALVGNAQAQRSTLGQLSFPESEEDIPLSRDLSSDESEEELDLQQGCQECRRRNTLVPDTPLAIAVKHQASDSVETLTQSATAAEFNVRDAEDWTLLHHATHLTNLAITTHLLSHPEASRDTFLNAQTKDGQTALMLLAAQTDAKDSERIAEELITRRCDVSIQDFSEDSRTALWWAVDGSHSRQRQSMVELLIRHGSMATAVRDGKLRDKAKKYPIIEEAAKLEEKAAQQQQRRATVDEPGDGRNGDDEAGGDANQRKDSLGRRLTNVFSDSSR